VHDDTERFNDRLRDESLDREMMFKLAQSASRRR
jgi:hypothetical protein